MNVRLRNFRPPASKWLAIMAHVLALAILTACERDPADLDRPVREMRGTLIAVIGPGTDHPQWPGIRGGARRYFDVLPGVRGMCVAPRQNTGDALFDTMRAVLDQQPAAVCVYVTNVALVRASIELAISRHVLVVTMGERVDDPRIYGHVDVSLPEAAELLAKHLQEVAADRRSYLLVHDAGRSPLDTSLYQRFITVARRVDDHVTLLDEVNAAAGFRVQSEVIEQLLRRFPHAGLVITLNPDVWLRSRAGWQRQLRDLNPTFRFATLAAVPALWSHLGTPDRPGEAAALVGPLDGDIGYAAAEIALKGIMTVGERAGSRAIRCELVLPKDLPDFARRYSEAADGLDITPFLTADNPPAATPSGTLPRR